MLFIALTSCENFLTAKDVKNQIEEAIEIANSNPITYYVIADNNSGTVNPSQLRLKKKETFDVMFTVAEGWNFIGWEVLDRTTYEVVEDSIKFDDPAKLETKGTVINPQENLMIHPKCQLVPRIVDIKPLYDTQGCRQDSTIIITFNKAIDPETFGNYTNISIKNPEGQELYSANESESYFGHPFFTNDNTILNIPTVKSKHILNLNSTKLVTDLTLNINLSSVKDTDGFAVSLMEPYTYCVNKSIDNVKPVLDEIHLYSTSDTTDYFYRELTNKAYDQWTSTTVFNADGTTKYQNGDFSRNHVGHIYFTINGSDNDDSGIKSVCVKETYKRDSSGAVVSSPAKTKDALVTRIDNSDLYVVDYQFNSENQNDGLYFIQVSIKDYAENESEEVYDYWVLKDTFNGFAGGGYYVVTYNLVNADISDVIPVYNSEKGIYEAPIGRIGTNSKNGTTGRFSEFLVTEDKYYSDYKSHRRVTFDIFDEDTPDNVISFNADIGTDSDITSIVNTWFADFKRNVDKTTVIRVTVEEESQVPSSYDFPIPKRMNVDALVETDSHIDLARPDLSYQPLGKTLDYVLYYNSENDTTLKRGETTSPTSLYWNSSLGNGTYNIYVIACMSQVDGNVFLVYSALGTPYIHYRNVSNPYYNSLFSFSDFSLPANNAIIYETNTGNAKFRIPINHANDGYKYNIVLGIYSFPEGSLIEVPNGYDYEVYINAMDSDGHLIGKSPSKSLSLKTVDNIQPYVGKDYTTNYTERFIDSESMIYAGNWPYDFTKNRSRLYLSSFDYYIIPSTYTGMVFDKDFLNGMNDRKRSAKVNVTQTQEDSTQRFNMYLGDADGSFRVIFYLKDESENEHIKALASSVSHLIADYTPAVSFNSTGSKLKISANSYSKDLCQSSSAPTTAEFNTLPDSIANSSSYVSNSFAGRDKVSIKYLEDNEWKEISAVNSNGKTYYPDQNVNMTTNSDNSWSYEVDYSAYQDKFIKVSGKFSADYQRRAGKSSSEYFTYNIFMKPVYVYSNYIRYKGTSSEIVCNSKGWMSLINGYQIFADKPCFVHVRYSPSLITSGTTEDDALEWEARGIETGVFFNNGTSGSFTYSDSHFSGVPSGYYYTTIVHFADGTCLMSDVKMKE